MAKRKFPATSGMTTAGLVRIVVEQLPDFHGTDLEELCVATEATIEDTFGFSIGFSADQKPKIEELETYFRGVLMVPERVLIVGRVDGVIAGSIQLVKPPASQQASSFAASVENHFVVPWARGHGLAKLLLDAAEEEAKHQGFSSLRLSVRASLEAAVNLYVRCGYTRWGTLEKYQICQGKMVAGHFYYKDL